MMPRKRWVRAIGGGVVLGLIGVVAGNLLFPDRTPALLAGLDSNYAKAGEQLTARARARFPAGTAETTIAGTLASEGFTIDPATRTASWQRKRAPCTDIARVWWTVEQGKVARVEALRNAICP